MATIKDISEHRKHKRFKVQEGAIAVLHDQKYKLGPVIDLTRDGLAFRYVYKEKKTNAIIIQMKTIEAPKGSS